LNEPRPAARFLGGRERGPLNQANSSTFNGDATISLKTEKAATREQLTAAFSVSRAMVPKLFWGNFGTIAKEV